MVLAKLESSSDNMLEFINLYEYYISISLQMSS